MFKSHTGKCPTEDFNVKDFAFWKRSVYVETQKIFIKIVQII